MEAQSVTLPLAFLAGLLSFASPCVLPLVPAYMGYLGGTALLEGREASGSDLARTMLHAVLFVLGFGLVFVLLGASATFVGSLLLDYSLLLQRLGGVLLVIFGLRLMAVEWDRQRWIAAAVVVGLVTLLLSNNLALERLEEGLLMVVVVLAGAGFGTAVNVGLALVAGVLYFLSSYDTLVPNLVGSLLVAAAAFFLNRADFFYSEKKIELQPTGRSGYARSLLFGVVFAAGWTPCVGPILTLILVVASQLDTVGQGILLLVAYTLGLGIPFLLVGLAFGPLSRWLRRMNRYLGIVSIVSGLLLVLMGVLIFTGSLGFLSQYGTFFNIEF
ncbi:MAG: cytochrome c biogenesis protein CcdA [Anaerolineae bacterium]|jgi:cytochrome c-type biogenesis protein